MKFKNHAEYMTMRNAIMKEAEDLVNAGKIEEANAKMEEAKQLDNEWDEFAKAKANIAALNNAGATVTQVTDLNNVVAGGVVSSSASFENTNAEKKKGIQSEEYRNAWVHAMKGQKLTDTESQLLDSVNADLKNMEKSTEHQLLIPETVKKGIWRKAGETHPAINDLMTTFIQGDIVIIKDESGDSDADWIEEDNESTDAEFAEGEIRLTGCEIAKSVTISWKLKKMNDQDYENYLIGRLGEKVGNTIAKSLFTGKGKPSASESFKPQARGVITALKAETGTPRIGTFTASAGVTYKKITEVMSKVKGVYKATGAIYANGGMIWNHLANILDNNGRPIFVPDVTASSNAVGRIFGVPVKEEDGMPDNSLLLGNFAKGYAFNFNETMSIYKEDHVKARKTDYMAYGIADGDIISTEAFFLLEKGA